MDIDIKAIDRQIRKLQKLKEFAKEFGSDPEMMNLLAEFATPKTNGNGWKPLTVAQTHESHETGKSKQPRGYLLDMVQVSIDSVPSEFTSDDIEKLLNSLDFEFKAAKPNIAINEALRTLESKGFIRRAGKRNGVQNVWTKTGSAVESRTA